MTRRINDPSFLIGNWKLNSNADDYSGHGNNGTWSGTELYTPNQFGKTCASLNGSSTITHASTATDTIAYWLDGDHWVYDGTTYYKNASSVGAFTVRSTPSTIGSGVTGKMYDVRHYNVALSAAEVSQLYSQGAPATFATTRAGLQDSSLVLYTHSGDKDYSAAANVITNFGATIGNRMVFDGVTDYISVADHASLDIIGAISIGAWFNVDSTAAINMIGDKYWDGANRSYYLRINTGGNIQFGLSASNGAADLEEDTGLNVVAGRYYYVMLTSAGAGGEVNCYLNGEPAGSSWIKTGLMKANTRPVTIGSYWSGASYTYPFAGTIADVKIYNEGKSAAWVKDCYLRTRKYY